MNPSKTLITCGCSFTQQPGWANYVNKHFTYEKLTNLAVGAGTNNTQINRINDFVLSNNQPFDLIWQITFPERTSNIRLPPDHPDVITKKYKPRIDRGFTYAQISPIKNYVDDQRHVDILHDGYVLPRQPLLYSDINNDVSRLLCTILLMNKVADHVMIFFGIDNVDQLIVDRMQEFFLKEKIPFVPYQHNLLGHVKHYNMAMAQDGWHPAQESYVAWADTVLIPAISAQWKT
jgi:hypothetical protein